MKLKDYGIMWIEDSLIYVADIDLYGSGDTFLKAVLEHIKALLGSHSEEEAGWFELPDYDKYLPFVTTAFMRHFIAYEPEWRMEYEAGKGRRKVWCVDFEVRLE